MAAAFVSLGQDKLVVQSHPDSQPGDDAGRLGYRQVIRAGSGATVYAVLHGSMHIRNGYLVYRFRPFSLSRPQGEGSTQAMAGLTSWRDDLTPGVSVVLACEASSQGCDDLAAQFGLASRAQDWTVWMTDYLGGAPRQADVPLDDPGSDLLAIVDRADRWPADDLQLLSQNPLLRRARRARVLLTACSAESWWPALRHRFRKAGITVA